MKKINEIRDYLIKHRTDKNGNLDLSGLNFEKVKGTVIFRRMKAKRIENSFQKAKWIVNYGQDAETIDNDLQKADKISNAYQQADKIWNKGQEAEKIIK